ncbi:hypothetical protein M0208_05700 [Sphingomonas sp. SUN019]|uniref:hypothetical protein n=1 Tax=Sphingomonas sp. SUN019 TaxID=2937788 RepID=UPI002164398C|nr:hypothetical protein [Sphingomonas sp. SUN019]UVO50038.1 hypothetical protein M0208_05700 [Sphingomonas sp. SUN019]
MTQVSGSHDTAPAQRPAARPQASRPTQPDDVRAMSDAFAAARAKMKPDGMKFEGPPGKQGKATLAKGLPLEADRKPADASMSAAFDRKVAERQQSERQADGQGLALPGQAAPPPPVMLAMMPSPQVDPGAFAQMLADLWTRENGKGAKEVRVKFGADAWPATDALLIRNAAGSLDISVGMASGSGAFSPDGLDEHLSNAGLNVGSFAVLPSGVMS